MQNIRAWLDSLPSQAGHYLISPPRRFAHEEANYDAGYANEPANREVGEGLINVCRAYGGDFNSPAIEIGCGTGLASLGLVLERAYPYVLLTDPSPVFLDIARKKINDAAALDQQVGFGVLRAEDLHQLPGGMFSLILLRSVLHHVLDVTAFALQAADALGPGGLMVMEEPCQESAVLMASIAQMMPTIVKQAGRIWSDACQRQLQLFLDTMKFYCNRQIDKSLAEDKHLFRVDELNAIGIAAGFQVQFAANQTFYNWTTRNRQNPHRELFSDFMGMYLRFAMGFDETFMLLFDEYLRPYCKWIDELSAQGNGPYSHGLFIWKKK